MYTFYQGKSCSIYYLLLSYGHLLALKVCEQITVHNVEMAMTPSAG